MDIEDAYTLFMKASKNYVLTLVCLINKQGLISAQGGKKSKN